MPATALPHDLTRGLPEPVVTLPRPSADRCLQQPGAVRVDIVSRQPGFAVPPGGRAHTAPTGEQPGGGRAAADGQRRLRPGPLEALSSVGAVLSCRRGQELYRRSDAADHWYQVVSGLAKEQALLSDGRRQILDFLLPGDCFGFGTQDQHQFAAEVVVNGTVVIAYPLREIERLVQRDPNFAMLICQLAISTMSRSQARTLTLGRTRAPQKVGSFILDMAERMADKPADAVTLPMSRYDIADYLGLSVETVSRCLTKLKCRGAIRMTNTRCVRILALEGLDLG